MTDIKQFERILIRGLLKGKDVARLMSTLTFESFEIVPMRVIFKAIQSYYVKFNDVPQLDILINEVDKLHLETDEFRNIEAFLTKDEDISEDKFNYALEEVSRETLSRALRKTMERAIALLDKGDPKKAQEILLKQSVESTNVGRDIKVIDFADGFVERRDTLLRRKEHPELFREYFVPTGIEKLDVELDGGLRKGELGLFLAPPESGKSISLQDISVSAVLKGFKVALFTIEMTAQQTAYRLDSRLTQIRYRKFRRADMEQEDLKIWDESISKVKSNQFKIISVPEGCSCRVIEAELARMTGSFEPDLIAVDYCGIMSPNEGKFETSMDWKYVGAIVRDLKGLALKLNIPVWSASQMLVGSKEKAEVKFVDVGLARQQIASHSDVCIAVIRTQQMQTMGIAKLQFVKVREGCENRSVEISPDYDRISLERRMFTEEGSGGDE